MKNKYSLNMLVVSILVASISFLSAGDQSMAQSKEKKSKKSGWLGVSIQTVTAEFAQDRDLKATEGVYVEEVVDDSPADSAGIKDGDVIISFDGKAVKDADEFTKAVQKTAPGKKVDIVLMRGSDRKQIGAVLSAGSPEVKVITRMFKNAVPGVPPVPGTPGMLKVITERGTGAYGMELETLNPQLGEYFGAPENKGVLVAEVKEDSKAAKAGFKAGDVIVRAGNKTVEKERDFIRAFQAYDEGDQVPVEIMRKGSKMTLNLSAEEEKDEDLLWNLRAPGTGFDMRSGKGGKNFFFNRKSVGPNGEDFDVDVEVSPDMEGLNESMKSLHIYIDKLNKDIKKDVEKATKDLDRKIRIKVKKDLKEVDEI